MCSSDPTLVHDRFHYSDICSLAHELLHSACKKMHGAGPLLQPIESNLTCKAKHVVRKAYLQKIKILLNKMKKDPEIHTLKLTVPINFSAGLYAVMIAVTPILFAGMALMKSQGSIRVSVLLGWM